MDGIEKTREGEVYFLYNNMILKSNIYRNVNFPYLIYFKINGFFVPVNFINRFYDTLEHLLTDLKNKFYEGNQI